MFVAIRQATSFFNGTLEGGWSALQTVARLGYIKKSTFALIDQAMFSATGFAVSLLLAHWLSEAEYGAYALIHSLFALVATLHTAILTEPMMVFGSGRYAQNIERYKAELFKMHAVVMGLFVIVLGAILTAIGDSYSPMIQGASIGAILASPLILLYWMVRRMGYVSGRASSSALISTLYFVCVVVSVLALASFDLLSPQSAFFAMGIAALLVTAGIVTRVFARASRSAAEPMIQEIARQHWSYGRWATGASGVQWMTTNIYYAVLPLSVGLEGAGALKAIMNLIMPFTNGVAALSMLFLPALVRYRKQEGSRGQAYLVKRALTALVSGALGYTVLLWIFRLELLEFLYAGRYNQYASWPLLFVAALPISGAATNVWRNALQAIERPKWVMNSQLIAGVAAVFIGIPLTATIGLSGAAAGLLLSNVMMAVAMAAFYRKTQRSAIEQS